MTAGDMYTVTGAPAEHRQHRRRRPGRLGEVRLPGRHRARRAPGDLYISDDYDNVVREIAAATGTQWGQAMTAGRHLHDRGHAAAGSGGSSGDGGPATVARC